LGELAVAEAAPTTVSGPGAPDEQAVIPAAKHANEQAARRQALNRHQPEP